MTEQLESELREALAARADELPAGAADRLRRRDYRQRTRRVGPPVAVGALSAAVAAAVGVGLVALGPDTSSAFAGWTARPTRVPAANVTRSERLCRARLAAAPPKSTRRGSPAPSVRRLTAVLADTRGPFTFVILAGRSATASCISGPSFTELSVNASPERVTASAGRAIVTAAPKLLPAGGHAYSFAQGVTGAGVTGVTLVLDDRTRVVASLGHGRFVAWWPGLRDAATADVTTATGTSSQRVPVTGPPADPPHGPVPTHPGTRSFGLASAMG